MNDDWMMDDEMIEKRRRKLENYYLWVEDPKMEIAMGYYGFCGCFCETSQKETTW
jgi:hypothetical protein